MHIIGASCEGFVHKEQNYGNQDRFTKLARGGVYTAVLCDGAGSYEQTAFGAESISKYMAGWLTDHFDFLMEADTDEIKDHVCGRIRKGIGFLRSETGIHTPHAFASTFLACLQDAVTGRFVALHLGDGMIAGAKQGGVLRMLTVPERSGDSATVLTTSSAELQRSTMKVVRGSGVDRVVMASDGAEGLLYRGMEVKPIAESLTAAAMSADFSDLDGQFQSALERSLEPMDDLTVVMLMRELRPTTRNLGYLPGMDLSLRRRLRRLEEYHLAREGGKSHAASAAHVYWKDKPAGHRKSRIDNARALGIM